MTKIKNILLVAFCAFASGCIAQKTDSNKKAPFVWENATVYFLLTDRFNNGNPENDVNFDRKAPAAKLRGFEGGDLKGISQKIDEGYFDKLGVTAIWLTPIVEQIHAGVDEGTGLSYGFHGYWTRDWTKIDPNFGTEKDLAEMVQKAHAHGIRVILDAVINHTGPVTESDPVWPSDWVRTTPQCDFKTYETTTACTLVKNLPDLKTESDAPVALPEFLVAKWKSEGRYDKEMKELDDFFKRTGYPRAPRFYIIKWLTDYITDFGIDGYRADTVKHVGEQVWGEFKSQCNLAFENWKKKNPGKVLDDNEFYTIAEVYNYGISTGKLFDFGDKKVNYYDNGFNNMINFEFKWDAQKEYETLFSKYSEKLNADLEGYSVLNYISSHDDSAPFDANRTKSFESAAKLLLSPGVAQIYYGDETARSLVVEGTQGDATLRSFMNWPDLTKNVETLRSLSHWRKIGQFRKNHPAVGAGIHRRISSTPYVFSRGFTRGNYSDRVIIGLDLPEGRKEIDMASIFKNNTVLRDAYSGKEATVKNGKIVIVTPYDIVLLEEK